MVIASLKIDYVAEMFYPGTVEVGSAVQRIGNKSFTVFSGAFMEGKLRAMAQSTLVYVGADSQKPAPLTASMRERLGKAIIKAGR